MYAKWHKDDKELLPQTQQSYEQKRNQNLNHGTRFYHKIDMTYWQSAKFLMRSDHEYNRIT